MLVHENDADVERTVPNKTLVNVVVPSEKTYFLKVIHVPLAPSILILYISKSAKV